jgi:hypothetical protein
LTVCEWFELKTTQTIFTGLNSKSVVTVSGGLASKSVTTGFSCLASKPVATVFSGLASKLVATVSPGLASKPAVGFLLEPQNQGDGGFSQFGSQNRQLRFGDLDLKITATVSWFGPQNQVGFDLLVAPQNRRREVSAGHASRSSGLLRVEASLARVCQSSLKTDEGATTSGARGTIKEVALEAS